jgi:hypothetical protein
MMTVAQMVKLVDATTFLIAETETGLSLLAALYYAVEHRTLFGPLMHLYELTRMIGSALNHEIGVIG